MTCRYCPVLPTSDSFRLITTHIASCITGQLFETGGPTCVSMPTATDHGQDLCTDIFLAKGKHIENARVKVTRYQQSQSAIQIFLLYTFVVVFCAPYRSEAVVGHPFAIGHRRGKRLSFNNAETLYPVGAYCGSPRRLLADYSHYQSLSSRYASILGSCTIFQSAGVMVRM